MRIFFADLVHSLPGNYTVPLNIASIAAFLDSVINDKLDISIFKNPNQLLLSLDNNIPDVIGLSNYSWNYDLNRQIGTYIKKHCSNTLIVMGGPNIRTGREGIADFLQREQYVDIYIPFEGEIPFTNFIAYLLESGDPLFTHKYKPIKGCAFLTHNNNLSYDKTDPPSNLNDFPSPYLNGYLDGFLKSDFIPLLETNRGCPYHCTYCSLGDKYYSNIRSYSLERIFDEMEYINNIKSPIPLWIIADSNFGLLERDELIAENIRKLMDNYSSPNKVLFWSDKRAFDRNYKIFEAISNLDKYLIAVQSLDQKVLNNIKRINVPTNKISDTINKAKNIGIKTGTDILLGLPGETKQSHLDTLKECFELGFDFIDCGNIRLLPGSELESDVSRAEYGIKTKYRLIQGSYGIYHGIKSVESEEVIRSTSSMTEDDMNFFRLVHWLIWLCWNAGFLAPVFRYIKFKNINPLDLIVSMIESGNNENSDITDLFDRFQKDTIMEWFDDYNELRDYYAKKQTLKKLVGTGFSKMNFKYTAELILHRNSYLSLLNYTKHKIETEFNESSSVLSEIFDVMSEIIINPNIVSNSRKLPAKVLSITSSALPFIIPNYAYDERSKNKILLHKDNKQLTTIKNLFKKFGYHNNRRFAIEKILEQHLDGFTYDISLHS